MTTNVYCGLHRQNHALNSAQAARVIATLWGLLEDQPRAYNKAKPELFKCVRTLHDWARDAEMYGEYVDEALRIDHDSVDAEAGRERVR
jgi:hypothetical protein